MSFSSLADNMPPAQNHFLSEPAYCPWSRDWERHGFQPDSHLHLPAPFTLFVFYDSINPFKWLRTHRVFIMASSFLPLPV